MTLDEILGQLWPAPCTVRREPRRLLRRPHPSSGEHAFVVLPRLSEPRLVLPTDARSAAAALGRARRLVSRKDRIVNAGLAVLLRGGAGVMADQVLVTTSGTETIESYLAKLFGEPVGVAIFLGPPRGNRKPVLQVLDRTGGLLGVAKLGIDDRTRDLVRAEASALALLGDADLSRTVVPSLIHHGRWRDIEVVIQTPLNIPQAAPAAGNRIEAMREVAGLRGSSSSLVGSGYLTSLEQRLAALPEDSNTSMCAEMLSVLLEHDDGRPMRFGCWHGDWSVWNMASARNGRVLVWDWERFATDVPLGYDPLHFEFMAHVNDPARVAETGNRLLSNAAQILDPFGVPAEQATTTAGLYLLELAARFRADQQDRYGLVGGRVARWLEPAFAQLRDNRPSSTATRSIHG